VHLGAGFAIQCSERFSTYCYYDGELGRRNYESNAVTGGFRIAFQRARNCSSAVRRGVGCDRRVSPQFCSTSFWLLEVSTGIARAIGSMLGSGTLSQNSLFLTSVY
jgi:hypothetical protein